MRFALTALGLALAPAPLVAAPAAQAGHEFAMTRSGVRVQISAPARKGDVRVDTPFGVFHTPTDPVQVTYGARPREEWRLDHRARGDVALLDWIETLDAEGRLEELAELAVFAVGSAQSGVALEAWSALERWGEKLDPVPRDVAGRDRLAWMRSRLLANELPEAVLVGGRYVAELPAGAIAPSDDRLTVVTIRTAVREGPRAWARAAARAAARQRLDEPVLAAELLHRAGGGDAFVADGCAEAVVSVWADQGWEYWARSLLRAGEGSREHAAWKLARWFPYDAPRALIPILATKDRRAGSRFDFAGRTYQAVLDRRGPGGFLASGRVREEQVADFLYARDPYEDASVVKVVPPSDELEKAILLALDVWAGERTGRATEDWIRWYEERAAP